jgi:hypothetical protein
VPDLQVSTWHTGCVLLAYAPYEKLYPERIWWLVPREPIRTMQWLKKLRTHLQDRTDLGKHSPAMHAYNLHGKHSRILVRRAQAVHLNERRSEFLRGRHGTDVHTTET